MSDGANPTGFAAKRTATGTLDTIWLDGEFVDWEDAQTHVLTHALHYGTSVFGGARCYETTDGPALFRWDDHCRRLYESAAVYGMELPYEPDTLTEATVELIRRQDLASCYVRPIAFFGYDRLGVSPTRPTELPVRVAIACWPWDAYLGERALEAGIDVTVSSWRKYDTDRIPATAKTGGPYVNGVLATDEAGRDGYDEAIMLNGRGAVAEGPGENVFLVRDGEVFTPALSAGALAGITRRSVCRLARDLGYPVHENASIGRGELYTADELFFTGTAAEVTPIRTVDGIPVGPGRPGPITTEIQSRFFDVVERRTDDYAEWFTVVE